MFKNLNRFIVTSGAVVVATLFALALLSFIPTAQGAELSDIIATGDSVANLLQTAVIPFILRAAGRGK